MRAFAGCALLLTCVASAPEALSAQHGQMEESRYHRAERLLGWHVDPLITGDAVVPVWMAGGNRFWYRNKTGDGSEFVLVDPVRGTRAPLFDRDRLAAAMSVAADTSFVGPKLPFQTFEFGTSETEIRFNALRQGFTCDLNAYLCSVGDSLLNTTAFVTSPDGGTEAFIHENDLWIRPAAGGDSTRLTTDGEELWAYGVTAPRPSQIISGAPSRPVLQWSPDGSKIAVQRMDERATPLMPLYSSTHERPEFYTYPYPLPGDSTLPSFDIHVVEVASGSNVKIDLEPQPYLTFSSTGVRDSTWVTIKWKDGGDRLYFTHATRGAKTITLYEADLATGAARAIVGDTSATHVELNLDIVGGYPNWDVLNDGTGCPLVLGAGRLGSSVPVR